MIAVALALGASLGWGCADFLGGLKSRSVSLFGVMLVSQVAGLVLIGLLVAFRGGGLPGDRVWIFAPLAGLAGTFGLALLYRGLAVGSMSVVAPITATAAVIPVAVGLARGEDPSGLQIAGALLALASVVLVSREAGGLGAGTARVAAGVGLAVGAAVAIGCFFLALDAAGGGDVYWTTLVQWVTTISLLALAAAATRARISVGRADLPALALVGALDAGANVLYVAATTEGFVSIVSVLASLYPVTTVALARLFLAERVSRTQEAGVVGALAGVALIAAG